MIVATKSGKLSVDARSHYCKWVIGFCSTPAWSSAYTLWEVWRVANPLKPAGVSWSAYGKICGILCYNGVPISSAFSH